MTHLERDDTDFRGVLARATTAEARLALLQAEHAALLARVEAAEQRGPAATAEAATLRERIAQHVLAFQLIHNETDRPGNQSRRDLIASMQRIRSKAYAALAAPDDGQRGREQDALQKARRSLEVLCQSDMAWSQDHEALAAVNAALDTPPAAGQEGT